MTFSSMPHNVKRNIEVIEYNLLWPEMFARGNTH